MQSRRSERPGQDTSGSFRGVVGGAHRNERGLDLASQRTNRRKEFADDLVFPAAGVFRRGGVPVHDPPGSVDDDVDVRGVFRQPAEEMRVRRARRAASSRAVTSTIVLT